MAARQFKRLSAVGVVAATAPGVYPDGDGLSLVVKASGSRNWRLRIMHDGQRRDLGIGPARRVTLAQARLRAGELRDQVKRGIDPAAEKKAARRARIAAKAESAERTFRAAAERLHASLLPTFRNPKHGAQWIATLTSSVFPALGDTPVAAIDGPMVMDVLEPLWLRTPETARRVRQRVGAVLDWAHARGWRERAPDLAAFTRRALAPQPIARGHHAAVDHPAAPEAVAALRAAPETVSRLGLLWTIYTAARSGETRGATWSEVDIERRLWTISAERMKAGRPHVVPLSEAALTVLARAAKVRLSGTSDELIFPGVGGRPMSDMTMGKVQARAAPGTTVHGWRSTFRDWIGETTNFPADVAEAALAHAIGNAVQRAYQRGDLLDKRRDLMEAWARYLDPMPANVARLPARVAA